MTRVLLIVAVVVMAVPATGQEVAGPGRPIPLATLGDQVITREEVERALRPQLDRIAERRQTLLDQKLGQLIGERLLAQEAKKRGVSVEALLEVEVHAKVQDVGDAEVAEFITRNGDRLPRGDEAKVRLEVRDNLRRQAIERQRQAYLRGLRAQATVTLHPEGPAMAQSLDSEQYARVVGKVLPAAGYTPLSANMSETAIPLKFRVEGEQGWETDEHTGAGPRWASDRGGGEGHAAAIHRGVQAEDGPGGRRL